MKKTLSFMVMAFALLFTQCRKPEVKFPTPSAADEGTTVSMTVTAGPGSKTDITTAGGITWSTGDKLYVGDGSKYVGYLTIVSGEGTPTGTFSGDVTLTGITEDTPHTFGFYYLGSAERTLTVGATSAVVDFSSQNINAEDGKLKNASAQHVGYGSASGTVKDGVVTGINVTLVSKVALARFSFTDGTTPYSGALTLSGVSNKMTVKFNGTGFSYEGSGDGISLTNTSASEKYVMLVPTGGTGDVALSFDGGGKTGGATIEGGIESNKFYGKSDAIAVSLHETVNFGAPNLNWSVCNLGATNGATAESWYGDYYQWGGVMPVTSTTINVGWDGCPFTYGILSSDNKAVFTKYVPEDKASMFGYNGFWDDETVLDAGDDAATVAWGSDWRMPTVEELESLYDNNTFEWLEANAKSNNVKSFTAVVAGCLVVKGKEPLLDASVYMFLPAAGNRDGMENYNAGTSGCCWSSSLYSDFPTAAYSISFAAMGVKPNGQGSRCMGCTVRPVR